MFHGRIQQGLLFFQKAAKLLQTLIIILYPILRHFRLNAFQLRFQRVDCRFRVRIRLTPAGILAALFFSAIILFFLLAVYPAQHDRSRPLPLCRSSEIVAVSALILHKLPLLKGKYPVGNPVQ